MEAHRKHMAQLFYKHLCDVIGTEEVVTKRRQIFYAADRTTHLRQNRDLSVISSGSKAEGLDLPGSDNDIMIIWNSFIVYEYISQLNNQLDTIPVLMNTTDTSPGFTKLQVLGDVGFYFDNKCCSYVNTKRYISSFLFRKFCLDLSNISSCNYLHGPCVSILEKYDIANCLRSTKWISQAYHFISRTKYSWASKTFLETLIQFGVLFVPIGSKNSADSDLEWRISFSFAEKLLIWSFSHVQLLCYALLKILLKEVIKRMVPDDSADLLCSYFLKTIMFWLCEETEVLQWKPENMLLCYSSALKRLIYCVEHKTCLHYFIPENNLFHNRFSDKEHNMLMSALTDLWNIGWTCLLETETLKSFKTVLTPLSSKILTVSYLPFLPNSLTIYRTITSDMHSCLYFCTRSSKKSFFIYNLSNINQNIAHSIAFQYLDSDGNKKKYKHYRKAMCHLLISVNHDAVSGWLLLASFFVSNKQYLLCDYLADFCLSTYLHERYLVFDLSLDTAITIITEDQHLFNQILRKLHPNKNADLTACKYFTPIYITCRGPTFIFPKALTSFLSNQPEFFISPAVFAHYLRFLCNLLGNKGIDQRRALTQLTNSVEKSKYNSDGNKLCLESALSLYEV